MTNYVDLALLRAEEIGIYNYKVEGKWLKYYSYFGKGDGFVKVKHNLETGEEVRKVLKCTKLNESWGGYNYYAG